MKRFVVLLTVILWINSAYAYKYLFDYTKEETAGNADWIVDGDYPYPSPANPTSETSWDRALSSWGYRLYIRNDTIVTLPPTDSITYGNASHTLDLSNFDVFVMDEPQDPLSVSEIQAILSFVRNGGGFFMISDHNISDRNNNGWDSPRVFNAAFEDSFGVHYDTTGDANNSISASFTNVSTDAGDSIIHGVAGDVDTFGYWSGTVLQLNTAINSTLQGHIWVDGEAQNSTVNVVFFTGRYGNGKIAGFGDSSPCDDGTGDPGDNIYDNWHDYADSTAILNASIWLAIHASAGNQPPVISDIIRTPSTVTDTDTAFVSAYITDDHAVSEDSLYYNVNGSAFSAVYHTLRSSDTSYFEIPPQNPDDTVNYYIIAVDDSGARTISDTYSFIVQNHTANQPPVIDTLWRIPVSPTDTDSVLVYAIITDDHIVATDSIYISLNSGAYNPYYHISRTGDTSIYSIGKYAQGTQVAYFVSATDDSAARSISDTSAYTVSSSQNQLNAGVVINEIMYNPATSFGNDLYYEYTEVWNATPDTVDMTGWYLMDNTPGKVAHVPPGTKVPPYYFVVFARNVDSLLAKSEYNNYLTNGDEILINIADSIQLSNSGEWVKLIDNTKGTRDSVSYDDASPWPTSPDGGGPSLELTSPLLDNNVASSWQASDGTTAPYGTPGDTNSVVNLYAWQRQHSFKSYLPAVIVVRSAGKINITKEQAVFDIKGRRISHLSVLGPGIYFIYGKNSKKVVKRFILIK